MELEDRTIQDMICQIVLDKRENFARCICQICSSKVNSMSVACGAFGDQSSNMGGRGADKKIVGQLKTPHCLGWSDRKILVIKGGVKSVNFIFVFLLVGME